VIATGDLKAAADGMGTAEHYKVSSPAQTACDTTSNLKTGEFESRAALRKNRSGPA
jgi:hypothetical protein